MKNLFFMSISYLIAFTSLAQAQNYDKQLPGEKIKRQLLQPISPIRINGVITGETILDDSVFFVRGAIDKKYFDAPIAPAKITSNAFTVETTIKYPQMRRIIFKSDRGKLIYRRGEYFIDTSTSIITTDYLARECNQVTGVTGTEYHAKFIPFFYSASTDYDCHQRNFDDLSWDEASQFDSTLYKYVQINPNSFVALWSLIERFSKFGHTQLRERTLVNFSKNIKASLPWQILNTDIHAVLIKQGARFPSFVVKGVSQPEQMLRLPKARYTLVDFWFCRCRPCIESFPALKKLYTTYQTRGFEIVSISTDKMQEVPLWKKRIKEYELPWIQYLDENAVAAAKLSVYSYPTTFLLDNKGKVLLRNITPEDLEKFLAKNLGN